MVAKCTCCVSRILWKITCNASKDEIWNGTYLKECLKFWGTESITFLHPNVSFQKRAGCHTPSNPLDWDHVTFFGDKSSLRSPFNKMSLESHGVEKFENFASCCR